MNTADSPSHLALPSDSRSTVGDVDLKGRAKRGAIVAILALISATCASFAWAASSPVGASPDEPAHIAYSWGAATGQVFPWSLHTTTSETGKTLAIITMPAELTQYPSPWCYRGGYIYNFDNTCTILEPTGDLLVNSYMAKYPMAYYLGTGALLRIGLKLGLSGFSTLFLTRVVSGLACWGAILLAGWVLAKRYDPRAVMVALGLSIVPMAQFLFSTINPNGLEIALAILLAAQLVAIRHDAAQGAYTSRWLQVALLLTVFILGWTRPLSMVWAGLLLLTLLIPLQHRGSVLSTLSKTTITALIATMAFLLGWLAYQVTGTKTDTSVGEREEWDVLPTPVKVTAIVFRFGHMVHQAFGNLGWLDTPLPSTALYMWLLIGAVCVTAFIVGVKPVDLRPSWALGVFLMSSLLVGFESYLAAFGWQGRYWLPPLVAAMVMLIPAMHGQSLSPRSYTRAWLVAMVTTVGISVFSLYFNMWRYRFGMESPFIRFEEMPNIWTEPAWDPSGGPGTFHIVIALGLVCAISAYTMWAHGASLRSTYPKSSNTLTE